MKLNNITKQFLNLEKKYDLFKRKNSDNIYFWDISRYIIYNKILDKLDESNNNDNNIRKYFKFKWIRKFKNLIKNEIYLNWNLHYNDYKYIFYIASRYKDSDGNYIDIASKNSMDILPDNKFVFESYNDNLDNSYYSHLLNLKKKIKNPKSEDFRINEILNSNFNTNIDFNNIISELIKNYKIEKDFYSKIFTKINPEIVFFTQNGIQKGMISAANDLNIPIVEFQHGLINFNHLAYSYNDEISYKHLNTLPKGFCLLADFWCKNVYYPVEIKKIIGNDHFFINKSDKEKQYLTIVFSSKHSENLMDLTQKMLKKYTDKVFIKLHPNQKDEIEYIKNELKDYENGQVIFDERSMSELLEVSHSMITIVSTAVYEALQSETKVFIYKKQNYLEHKDVFDNKNVYLFNSIDKLFNNINNEYHKDSDNIYFEPFKEHKFRELLKEIKSDYK